MPGAPLAAVLRAGDKLGRDPGKLLMYLKERVGVHTYCFTHINEHTKQVGWH
jgi:hypothetical protein